MSVSSSSEQDNWSSFFEELSVLTTDLEIRNHRDEENISSLLERVNYVIEGLLYLTQENTLHR